MASDRDHGTPGDRPRGDLAGDRAAASESGLLGDRTRPDGDQKTPESLHGLELAGASLPTGWADETSPRKSEDRSRSRQRNGRGASGQTRICNKCGEPLTGQFVRALDGTFHLDCFKCRVSPSRLITAPSPSWACC